MSMSPLRQPIHILRKDAIHLWPEILVSVALLAAYAWSEAQTWLPSDGTFNPVLIAVGFLKFLIPIAWLVLISRLVHDEELVGDRQFWVTRPYTWYSLILSKILFIILFICVPFLIMQMILLHHAGLYPTRLIPGMLKNMVYVSAIFLLPLFAIAAVTSTFVRYISSALGGLIYFFIIFALAAYFWPDNLTAPHLAYALNITILAMLIAALLLQYWRRKTLIARILIGAVPLVVLLFAALAPLNLLSSHRYPNTSAGALTFNKAPEFQQLAGRLLIIRHKVILGIPVQAQLTGLPSHAAVEIQRFRAILDGPAGFHYTSDWNVDRAFISPLQPSTVTPLSLPESVFNRIHNQPVALHLQLGTQIHSSGTPYSVTATDARFPLPGHAGCTLSPDDGSLNCRFAFADAQPQQVEATVTNGNCLTPGPQTARAIGLLTPPPSLVSFSPVDMVNTSLKVGGAAVPLCPGTRITVTPSVDGAYGRLTLDIPSITLDPYAIRIQDERQPQPQPNPPTSNQ
jgi:hypothetical protein